MRSFLAAVGSIQAIVSLGEVLIHQPNPIAANIDESGDVELVPLWLQSVEGRICAALGASLRCNKLKPCDALTAEDFEVDPIWGFDLSVEGSLKVAGETWIRPDEYRSVPETSDVLFAAAQLQAGDHPLHQGAVCCRLDGGKPNLIACVLLKPRYCAVSIELEKARSHLSSTYVERTLGSNFSKYFPIVYEAMIVIGGQCFPVAGTLALPVGF